MFTPRQKEILDAAISLIAHKGIQDVTMKNLSLKVGISEPALYRHFKNKHDILVGVLDSFHNQNKLITKEPIDMSKSALENLKDTVMQVFQKFMDYPELANVIFSEEIFKNDKTLTLKVKKLLEENRKVFKKIIEYGIHDGSLGSEINKDDMSLIVIGVMRLLVIRWRLSEYSFDLVKRGKLLFERSLSVLLER